MLVGFSEIPTAGFSEIPTAEVVIGNETAVIPDIGWLTLDTFGKLPNSELGAADILTLGDLSEMIDLRDFTLGSASEHWPSQLRETVSLNQYPFLAQMTIADIATAANLYSKEVGDILIVKVALEDFLRSPVLAHQQKLTLYQLLEQYPELENVKLEFLDLSKYTIEAIPGILNTPINAIPDWQSIRVSEVPGLREIPIHQSIQLNGEIVSILIAQRDGKAVVNLAQKRPYQSMTWNSDESEGLRPFGSFSIVPVIKDNTVQVEAYFKSCAATESQCEFVGPFKYLEYKPGDLLYVSADDWAEASLAEKAFPDYKKDVASSASIEPDDTLSSSTFIRAIAAGMIAIVGCGVPTLYLLLSSRRKSKS